MNRGRPKKGEDNKRNVGINVRLTQEEKEMLEMISSKYNVTKSDVLRNSIYQNWNVLNTTGKPYT